MRSFLVGPIYRGICWFLFTLWFLGLNFLSSLSSSDLPKLDLWKHMDKVFHFSIFSIGGFLLATAWAAGKIPPPFRRFILAFALLAVFGLIDEIRQLATPGRTGGDWGDALANTLGSLTGVAFSWFLHAHFLRLLAASKPLPPPSDG